MANHKEHWLKSFWRPLAMMSYLIICLVDFVAMPVYYEWSNNRLEAREMVMLARTLNGAQQVEALRVLRENRSWQPITLSESGLLHISFGAIGGVSAFSRGQEKRERAKNASADELPGEPQ